MGGTINKNRGVWMAFTFKKYLIRVMIIIVSFFIAANIYMNMTNQNKPVQIIQQEEQISSSQYIINKSMIMSNLKQQSQIVSLEQNLDKKDTYVDSNWLGQRETDMTVHGIYKIGLNTNNIEVKHIDSESGIVYIKLGKPILISLELPYDDINFSKAKGFLRLAMSEEEQKNFYKSVEKEIRKELMNDKELHKQADLYNQDVVRGLLKDIAGVKSVVFE